MNYSDVIMSRNSVHTLSGMTPLVGCAVDRQYS